MLRLVLTLTFSRLVVNTCRRFAYPFLPALARELAVAPAALQGVLAVQGGAGVLSPLAGPLAERHGRRRLMLAPLAAMAVVAGAAAVIPGPATFVVALVAFGAGKMVHDPALQAYLGDRVPYARRGLAMGATELSWAGSLLLVSLLTGRLLEAGGARLLAGVWGLLLAAAALAVARWVPADAPAGGAAPRATSPGAAWRVVRGSRAARGALGFSLLLVVANEAFFINYGLWLERSFGLSLAAVGAATLTIAAAEASGELVTMALADRLGKRRLALAGAVLSVPAYLALPLLPGGLPVALAGLFALFLCVEVAIVASIPLFTAVLPGARAVMMSGNMGAHSLGRLGGATLGGALWAVAPDARVVCGAAAALAAVSALLLGRFVGGAGGWLPPPGGGPTGPPPRAPG